MGGIAGVAAVGLRYDAAAGDFPVCREGGDVQRGDAEEELFEFGLGWFYVHRVPFLIVDWVENYEL
jgi:hypothetical protein